MDPVTTNKETKNMKNIDHIVCPIVKIAVTSMTNDATLFNALYDGWIAAQKIGVKSIEYKNALREEAAQYEMTTHYADGSTKKKNKVNTINAYLIDIDGRHYTKGGFRERKERGDAGATRKPKDEFSISDIRAAAESAGLTAKQIAAMLKALR